MYNELHSSLDQKVKTSQRLVEKLSHRAQSVENSLQHTRRKQWMGWLHPNGQGQNRAIADFTVDAHPM
jgi:hypothetical protein